MEREKLENWYMETFANKEPTTWCRVITRNYVPRSLVHMVISDHSVTVDEEIKDIKVNAKLYYDHYAISSMRMALENFDDIYDVIGHPITWGVFDQEVTDFMNTIPIEKAYLLDELKELKIEMRRLLLLKKMLGQTIYEWVEEAQIKNILVSIKACYEKIIADS